MQVQLDSCAEDDNGKLQVEKQLLLQAIDKSTAERDAFLQVEQKVGSCITNLINYSTAGEGPPEFHRLLDAQRAEFVVAT